MTTTNNSAAIISLVSSALVAAQADENKNKGFYTSMLEASQLAEDKQQFLDVCAAAADAWRSNEEGMAEKAGAVMGDKGKYLVPSSLMTAKSQLKAAFELEIDTKGKKYQQVVKLVREAKAAQKAEAPAAEKAEKAEPEAPAEKLEGTLADIQQQLNTLLANAKQLDDAGQKGILKALEAFNAQTGKALQQAA